LEIAEEDIEWEPGKLFAKGAPQKAKTIQEIAFAAPPAIVNVVVDALSAHRHSDDAGEDVEHLEREGGGGVDHILHSASSWIIIHALTKEDILCVHAGCWQPRSLSCW
jgi:hypothetical protein